MTERQKSTEQQVSGLLDVEHDHIPGPYDGPDADRDPWEPTAEESTPSSGVIA